MPIWMRSLVALAGLAAAAALTATAASAEKKYDPGASDTEIRIGNINAYAYVESQAMMQVIKQCGDDLTRENVMKQAANLKNFTSDMLLPGVTINTSPDDYFPIEQMQLMRFNGEAWELFGDVITGEIGHDASH
jgi:hypothetical protein